MKIAILVLAWLTVMVIGTASFFVWHTNDQRQRAIIDRQNQIKELGSACIHHVHNISNPADSKKMGIYGNVDNPVQYELVETLECLKMYPLYSEQAHYSQFNTTLN